MIFIIDTCYSKIYLFPWLILNLACLNLSKVLGWRNKTWSHQVFIVEIRVSIIWIILKFLIRFNLMILVYAFLILRVAIMFLNSKTFSFSMLHILWVILYILSINILIIVIFILTIFSFPEAFFIQILKWQVLRLNMHIILKSMRLRVWSINLKY